MEEAHLGRLVAPTVHEIVCHNDWSPWNALLRDGHAKSCSLGILPVRGPAFDGYDLEDRSEVLLTMRRRLVHVGRCIESEARAGDPGMRRLVNINVPGIMFENDVRYLDDRWSTLERGL